MELVLLQTQGDHYEFTHLRLNDVYEFEDGMVSYLHMNFKATNAATGSEKTFFAELALDGDILDKHGGYRTITCSIVDDECVGMLLLFFIFSLLIQSYMHASLLLLEHKL